MKKRLWSIFGSFALLLALSFTFVGGNLNKNYSYAIDTGEITYYTYQYYEAIVPSELFCTWDVYNESTGDYDSYFGSAEKAESIFEDLWWSDTTFQLASLHVQYHVIISSDMSVNRIVFDEIGYSAGYDAGSGVLGYHSVYDKIQSISVYSGFDVYYEGALNTKWMFNFSTNGAITPVHTQHGQVVDQFYLDINTYHGMSYVFLYEMPVVSYVTDSNGNDVEVYFYLRFDLNGLNDVYEDGGLYYRAQSLESSAIMHTQLSYGDFDIIEDTLYFVNDGNLRNDFQFVYYAFDNYRKVPVTMYPEFYDSGNDYYNTGYNIGFRDGQQEGYTSGYNQGEREGRSNGFNSGYTQGETAGYSAGVASANDYTFIGLLGAVVDAPVKAFTGLLNFDILGVNLSGFVLGLFSIALIIWILRKVRGNT